MDLEQFLQQAQAVTAGTPMQQPQQQQTEGQPAQPGESIFPNVALSEADQQQLVSKCLQFKTQVNNALRLKKEKGRTSYAYYRGEFVKGDGLPIPMPEGNQNSVDAARGRTRFFLPISKQIAIQLYSGIYLSLMPDDEGYFAIRSRSGNYAQYEDGLTRALEYILKQAKFRSDYGCDILNRIIFGYSASAPTMCADMVEEWEWSDVAQNYILKRTQLPPYPKLQVMNPIQYSPDPSMAYGNKSKWVYMDSKKRQELLDAPFYFNKDKIRDFDCKESRQNDKQGEYPDLNTLADMVTTFTDIEPNLRYDLYYIPYIKLGQKEYRNFLCGVVEDQILVRFQPNPFPKGLNPVVCGSWRPDPQTPLGDGPLDDIQEIQKLINIYENYKIDVMSRTGNKFVVKEGTDMTQAFGQAVSLIYAENPQADVVPLTGDMVEAGLIQNMTGVLKAEAQILTGSNQPFQGSSDIDYKKTATELKIIQENSITIAREVIEHIAQNLKDVLIRFCWMIADEYTDPVRIRLDDSEGGGIEEVDFSIFKSGDFEIEITTVNPNQSREAQAEMLTQMLGFVPPDQLAMLMKPYEIVKKLGETRGLRSLKEVVKTPQELAFEQQQAFQMQQQLMQQQAMELTAPPPAV